MADERESSQVSDETEKLTHKQLHELLETCRVATKGPWKNQPGFNTIYTTSDPESGTGITITIAKTIKTQCEPSEIIPNADLMAAARTALPNLIEEVLQLRERNRELSARPWE